MAELTFDGATWRGATPRQALLITEASLACRWPDVTVQVTRAYEGPVGATAWDVAVQGVSIDVVQGIEADLADIAAAEADDA